MAVAVGASAVDRQLERCHQRVGQQQGAAQVRAQALQVRRASRLAAEPQAQRGGEGDFFGAVGLGGVLLCRKTRRLSLMKEVEKLPPCVVGMDACLSAHSVSRTLRKLGFNPRIRPAKYTKPFVKGQKNDYYDAEAIA